MAAIKPQQTRLERRRLTDKSTGKILVETGRTTRVVNEVTDTPQHRRNDIDDTAKTGWDKDVGSDLYTCKGQMEGIHLLLYKQDDGGISGPHRTGSPGLASRLPTWKRWKSMRARMYL
ncbi:hypothetical protein EVAR_3472_1 [Eumeta japonica]|uniref:Uncharacterized protein n=1 Tax=Eumeta variegata TaxID=151549 RepID=A0A4C1SSQ6_EUMVA|nr:hypothetical protein EVAR_3472_1 [Eumeta japonica]